MNGKRSNCPTDIETLFTNNKNEYFLKHIINSIRDNIYLHTDKKYLHDAMNIKCFY